MSGRVVHFEIPFDDGDRARGFYKAAFGWDIQMFPEMDYTIVSTGPTTEQGPTDPGFINGGLLPRELSPSGAPVIVVGVDSIDETLGNIEELGGSTVAAKQAVADMGFAAYFKDLDGNVIGLWENA